MGKPHSELLTLIKRLLKQAYRGPHTTHTRRRLKRSKGTPTVLLLSTR